jgi:hypothetical protein
MAENENLFGYHIADEDKKLFYSDNWESKNFKDNWNALWKEIIRRFKVIYNEKPLIGLTVFIYSPSKINKICHTEVDATSYNGLFIYSWKYCSNLSLYPVTSNGTFEDIVTCYNSFVDFYRKISCKEKFGKLDIVLIYKCKTTKYGFDLYESRKRLIGTNEQKILRNESIIKIDSKNDEEIET